MNFVTFGYIAFFVFVFAVYWQLGRRAQSYFLVVVSYVFYAYWDWRFLSLVIISTVLDFYAARQVFKASSHRERRFWLLLSIVGNLTLLGYFKYYNFFLESFVALSGSLGLHVSWTTANIILPVGISFYTFESLSYTIDIYRGSLKPTPSVVEYAAFVAFFPHLIAGPIVRASELLFQLEKERTFSPTEFESGLRRFILGFFKKAFVADYLAIHVVDPVFASPGSYTSGALWLGLLGYTVQIYCDFSGYSSMAIGSARMLGLHIPENFSFPYLATSMSDFWRRWHMTMSRFFRDYVYISLGGNRGGTLLTLRNLAATTLLSGLWHGANMTFVVWGGLHGLCIAVNQLWRQLRNSGLVPAGGGFPGTLAAWILVQGSVLLAWIVFRSQDFRAALAYIVGLFDSPGATRLPVDFLVLLAFAVAIVDHAYGWLSERPGLTLPHVPALAQALFLSLLIVFTYQVMPPDANPFIYFQF